MKTIIVDYELNYFHSVEKEILFGFPKLNISGYASCCEEASKLIHQVKPALVLMEVNMPKANAFQFLTQAPYHDFETIFVSHSSGRAIDAIRFGPSGYLLKPLKAKELLNAIKVAQQRINTKSGNSNLPGPAPNTQLPSFPENIIGIPTMGGLDFIPLEDIIRCEGFQKCTRIITKDRSDIFSSYHIGIFKKRLGSSFFYSPHKSHLINLLHIRKYLKEGTIKMSDGNYVPVSKRRKSEFIKLLGLSR